MMQWAKRIFLSPLSLRTTTLWGESKVAVPWITPTLRWRANPARPRVSLPTISSL